MGSRSLEKEDMNWMNKVGIWNKAHFCYNRRNNYYQGCWLLLCSHMTFKTINNWFRGKRVNYYQGCWLLLCSHTNLKLVTNWSETEWLESGRTASTFTHLLINRLTSRQTMLLNAVRMASPRAFVIKFLAAVFQRTIGEGEEDHWYRDLSRESISWCSFCSLHTLYLEEVTARGCGHVGINRLQVG